MVDTPSFTITLGRLDSASGSLCLAATLPVAGPSSPSCARVTEPDGLSFSAGADGAEVSIWVTR